MTNEEYYNTISAYIVDIKTCISDALYLAKQVVGGNFIHLDLYYCGLLDRSIKIAQGFISMLESRNLTCVGALLRLQIDNCLRFYALHIAEDEDAVLMGVLQGNPISMFKDKKGEKMTDAYLQKEIKKLDKQLPIVYKNASGFIHFSDKAIFQSVQKGDNFKLNVRIGGEFREELNDVLIEGAAAFIHYFRFLLHMTKSEADWKKKYDEEWSDKQ